MSNAQDPLQPGPARSGAPFVWAHRVSYSECTIGNHVYYSRYLDILEQARGEFFRHLGHTFADLHEKRGAVFPVIEARLRYRAAARYDDVLRVEIWMDEVARVRLKIGHRILNSAAEILVEAETTHACTGTDDRLKRIPEDLSEALENWLKPQA